MRRATRSLNSQLKTRGSAIRDPFPFNQICPWFQCLSFGVHSSLSRIAPSSRRSSNWVHHEDQESHYDKQKHISLPRQSPSGELIFSCPDPRKWKGDDQRNHKHPNLRRHGLPVSKRKFK